VSDRRDRPLSRAIAAHTDLVVFATIADTLEGGHLYDPKSNAAAARIIKICRAEAQRHLRVLDQAEAEINAMTGAP
jgi:hypothetical protein